MHFTDPQLVNSIQTIIEILGTLAFAISGIRHAAAKHFDWFGGFVCGFAVAIGGGTLREVMLGLPPFWMTSPLYIVCTIVAQIFVISFSRMLKRLDNELAVALARFHTFDAGLFDFDH